MIVCGISQGRKASAVVATAALSAAGLRECVILAPTAIAGDALLTQDTLIDRKRHTSDGSAITRSCAAIAALLSDAEWRAALMIYLVQCRRCHATNWCSGTNLEPGTVEVEPQPGDWQVDEDDPKSERAFQRCQHEDWDVVDFEYPEPYE